MAFPELILSAELSPADQRKVQRQAKDGELQRIQAGIYTALGQEEWPSLIARNRYRVLNALYPDAVVGYRSAMAGGMPVEDRIYLNYTYPRVASLPGLQVVLVRGPGRLAGDMTLAPRLFLASEPRQALENLAPRRGAAAGEAEVERRLLEICDARGDAALNVIRDQARQIAPQLDRARELTKLDSMIGAILGTRPNHRPATTVGQAVARGIDAKRIDLFDQLVAALNARPLQAILDVAPQGNARVNAAFYESYFSNYIEGTKFTVEEAEEIVLKGRAVPNRPNDSKDVQGVFRQANESAWRVQTLASGEPVLQQLRARHEDMMKDRPEADPGRFKDKSNRAGSTEFVHPKLVTGTLIEASSRLTQVPAGVARAILAHFIVAEIHPFADGNGRISRLVMNAELTAAGLSRIIIPTLSRDDYMGTLKLLTHEGNADPFIRCLAKIQRWTAEFDYSDLDQLRKAMERCSAIEEDTTRFRLGWPNGSDPNPEEDQVVQRRALRAR